MDYLHAFEEPTRTWLKTIFNVLDDALGDQFEAGMLYYMPSFYVSLKDYPKGYHAQAGTPLPFVSFAKQKHHVSVYVLPFMTQDVNQGYVEKTYEQLTGKPLKHGKSCLIFKKPEDLPLSWLAELVKVVSKTQWIALYEQSLMTKGRKFQKI
jgi:hypothetical protein